MIKEDTGSEWVGEGVDHVKRDGAVLPHVGILSGFRGFKHFQGPFRVVRFCGISGILHRGYTCFVRWADVAKAGILQE